MNYNFYIDPIRRTVTPESMTVLWLDQDVTTIHFTVEDFEGFTFDGSSILIKAVLPDRTQVEITPENFSTEPITTEDDEGQTVITGYSTSFDWTLTLEHTKAVGLLTYSICAIMLNLDGETVDKEWHTLNDSFQIRDHIHFNGSDDQDDPVTAATNAEKIAALKAQVDGLAGGVKTAGAVSQMTDTTVAYVYTGTETGYTKGNWYYWSGSAWVSGGTYGGAVTDPTLSVAGAAADAKAVGDAMAGVGAASVPTEVRQAMKTLFEKAAYIETGLADEVAVITAWAEATTSITVSPSTASVSNASSTAQLSTVTTPAGNAVTWSSSNTAVATVSSTGLVTAVGNGTATITATSGNVSASCAVTVTGFRTLTGIEATFTQSGTVYDTASLDDLEADLVVTGTYDDSTTAVITDYTLSGTLAEGTSTITVSYGGFTDTFSVTVSHATTDTTAQIATSGEILVHLTNEYATRTATNGGITVLYEMDAATTTLFPAGIIPTDSANDLKNGNNVACLFIYDSAGEPINFVNELTTSSLNRWAQNRAGTMTEYSNSYTVGSYSKIAFSVDTRYLDDAYMYDKTTGQVWFAGINTPYYGMSNISEASS